MGVMPRTLLEKIQWAEAHIGPFNSNAVAIGTTVGEAASFETKTEAARAALTSAEAARDAAKNATLVLKNAVEAVDISAASIIKQVRAKAESTGNPDVYALASIPAPATPSPVGAPGTCSDFKARLLNDGSVESTWKANNPARMTGVTYQVWRRFGSEGEFSFIGASGEKKFIDSTIPVGTAQVQYQIRGIRPTSAGEWAQFNVNFGQPGSGMATASVSEANPAKIAA